jgi:hypothetical protein
MFLGGRPQDHERSAPSCFLTWSSSTPLRIEPPAGEFAGRCRRQRTLGGTHGPEAHANVTRYLYSYNRLHVMSIENGYQAQYSCVLLHEQRLAMPITLPPRRPSCGGCSERSSCLLCPDASLVMSRTLPILPPPGLTSSRRMTSSNTFRRCGMDHFSKHPEAVPVPDWHRPNRRWTACCASSR